MCACVRVCVFWQKLLLQWKKHIKTISGMKGSESHGSEVGNTQSDFQLSPHLSMAVCVHVFVASIQQCVDRHGWLCSMHICIFLFYVSVCVCACKSFWILCEHAWVLVFCLYACVCNCVLLALGGWAYGLFSCLFFYTGDCAVSRGHRTACPWHSGSCHPGDTPLSDVTPVGTVFEW